MIKTSRECQNMNKIKEFFSRMFNNGLGHWYTHTWLIAALFLLWPLVFPPIIGIYLIAVQNCIIRENFSQMEKENNFAEYVESKNMELTNRELSMLQNVTDKARQLLLEDHEKNIEWCKKLKESTIEKCNKTQAECESTCQQLKREADELREKCKEMKSAALQENESIKANTMKECQDLISSAKQQSQSLIQEAKKIKAEAEGYEKSVYNRCGAIKEQTESECKKMCLDAERDSDRIKYRWEKIRIFTDSHYKKIQSETNEWMQRIDSMSNGHDFERFFADLLRLANYDHVEVTKGSGDKGADVLAAKDGIKYAIQCKRYNQRVDTSAVQEATSGKMFYECHVAIVATNRGFTNSAIELATKTGVILWDRKALRRMVFDYCRTMYIRAFDIEDYTE